MRSSSLSSLLSV
ncbi:hypothetical protein D046_0592, partial [Vibrio parahaemolyticus V-223/04]